MSLDELEVHCLFAILTGTPDINPSHAVKQAVAVAKAMYAHQANRSAP